MSRSRSCRSSPKSSKAAMKSSGCSNGELGRRDEERTAALAERNRVLEEKEVRLNLAVLQNGACTVEADRLSWSESFSRPVACSGTRPSR